MAVKVAPLVMEQLERVRQSGLTNMFDFHAVQRIAHDNNFFELVIWMEEHKNDYGKLIMYGPEGDYEVEKEKNNG